MVLNALIEYLRYTSLPCRMMGTSILYSINNSLCNNSGSFVLMGGVFALERRGHLKKAFLSAIALIALVQLGLFVQSSGTSTVGIMAALLFAFFCARLFFIKGLFYFIAAHAPS